MIAQKQVYKCKVCGNVVEVIYVGGGVLSCCNQDMELLAEKTDDTGREKHVPVIEKTAGGIKIKVGSIAHPMEENHYIAMIEMDDGNIEQKTYLKPGDAPEAEFATSADIGNISAREYCTVHGLWKS